MNREVKTEPVEKTKGFIVPIILALTSLYKDYQNQQKYTFAQNYNATVFYRKNENNESIVEKIIFSRKQK